MKSQIHLIRHGITEGNQKRFYYGTSDISLAPEGIEKLKELVKEGIYPRVENPDYYTSGLIRTEETFKLIYGEKEHRQITELQEMGFGEFEMKSYEDLKEIQAYQEWISDKSGTAKSPGGESIVGFGQRISGGFKKLMNNHQKKEITMRHKLEMAHSIVVCHGGVISAIIMECFNIEMKDFYKGIPDPGHGYTLNIVDGKVVDYDRF
ncbi:MAG: histidine phosphatase family protein [Anaerovoracaceae bacterium]